MAKTIEQIQDMITSKNDAREVINEIADYLQANPGGGLAMESYQNSVMSASVQAYVFRDADDNIVRVYEPSRSNDVSRNQFAYADSIDKFPFDDTSFYGNVLSDVKLINLGAFYTMTSNRLFNMVIDFNGNEDLNLENCTWYGGYGQNTPHSAEVYLSAPSVDFKNCTINVGGGTNPTYFDSCGGNSLFQNITVGGNGSFNCGGNKVRFFDVTFGTYITFTASADNVFISDAFLEDGADVNITKLNGFITESKIGIYCDIICFNPIQKTTTGAWDSIDTTNGGLTRCNIADNLTYAPSSNQADVQIVNVAGTAYILGESSGNATLTAA